MKVTVSMEKLRCARAVWLSPGTEEIYFAIVATAKDQEDNPVVKGTGLSDIFKKFKTGRSEEKPGLVSGIGYEDNKVTFEVPDKQEFDLVAALWEADKCKNHKALREAEDNILKMLPEGGRSATQRFKDWLVEHKKDLGKLFKLFESWPTTLVGVGNLVVKAIKIGRGIWAPDDHIDTQVEHHNLGDAGSLGPRRFVFRGLGGKYTLDYWVS